MSGQQKKLEVELEAVRKELVSSLQANQALVDEHQALQLVYSSHELKLKEVEAENDRLVSVLSARELCQACLAPQRTQLISYKAKDADRLNDENDKFRKEREQQLKEEIEQATREPSATAAPSSSKADKKGRKASSSVSEGAAAPSICPTTPLESMVTTLSHSFSLPHTSL